MTWHNRAHWPIAQSRRQIGKAGEVIWVLVETRSSVKNHKCLTLLNIRSLWLNMDYFFLFPAELTTMVRQAHNQLIFLYWVILFYVQTYLRNKIEAMCSQNTSMEYLIIFYHFLLFVKNYSGCTYIFTWGLIIYMYDIYVTSLSHIF